ncbi:MAG: hypothetical protein AAGG68_19595, partial [Bacteroidota bacterium]
FSYVRPVFLDKKETKNHPDSYREYGFFNAQKALKIRNKIKFSASGGSNRILFLTFSSGACRKD